MSPTLFVLSRSSETNAITSPVTERFPVIVTPLLFVSSLLPSVVLVISLEPLKYQPTPVPVVPPPVPCTLMLILPSVAENRNAPYPPPPLEINLRGPVPLSLM